MRKARFSEEQITYALRQVESGKPVGEVCRQIGVSEQSFYRRKRKYEEWQLSRTAKTAGILT